MKLSIVYNEYIPLGKSKINKKKWELLRISILFNYIHKVRKLRSGFLRERSLFIKTMKTFLFV